MGFESETRPGNQTFASVHSEQYTISGRHLSLILERGGGGHSLIKVDADVRRVQNLGRAKFLQQTWYPGQKGTSKSNDRASFHEL